MTTKRAEPATSMPTAGVTKAERLKAARAEYDRIEDSARAEYQRKVRATEEEP